MVESCFCNARVGVRVLVGAPFNGSCQVTVWDCKSLYRWVRVPHGSPYYLKDISMTNEEMLAKLRTEICEVTFVKKDGSDRVMICTRKPSLMPEIPEKFTKIPEEDRLKADYMPVYDLEEQAWRAFKPSMVTNFISSPE